tara:strand:+ start:464 stop:856 length:393 start_codon:yes stop_codon:yes gene_type:complete
MNKLKEEAENWMRDKYSYFSKNILFDTYQKSAIETAIYPDQYKILYPALGLAAEAGEVANKVKKLARDGEASLPENWREQVAAEIGDVLWYCAALAHDLDMSLSVIAAHNKEKLASRKQRGKLSGNGDDR